MKYIKAFGLWFLCGLFQWLWAAHLSFLGRPPHFFLPVVVAGAIVLGGGWGQSFGFFGGLWVDVFAVRLFGATALSFCWIGYGVGLLRRQMDVSNVASQWAVVAVASLVHGILMYLLSLFFLRQPSIGFSLGALLWTTILNTLLAPAAFWAVGLFERQEKMYGKS